MIYSMITCVPTVRYNVALTHIHTTLPYTQTKICWFFLFIWNFKITSEQHTKMFFITLLLIWKVLFITNGVTN